MADYSVTSPEQQQAVRYAGMADAADRILDTVHLTPSARREVQHMHAAWIAKAGAEYTGPTSYATTGGR